MGATHSTDHPVTLQTPRGTLHGIEQRDATTHIPVLHRYTQIPYAQPPVGPLRFRKPKPLPADHTFSSSAKHSTFGPICPQPDYAHSAAALENPRAAPEPANPQDEDCLYLNVWVPCETEHAKRPAAGWPVQFHIHGGWLQVGDANQGSLEDPFDLLRDTTKRIIVAPTYRLNIFGFLAGPQVAAANGADGGNGNYGLWDQRMALEWVYENISLFGGDRDLITVGGLSAGAHSAILQLYFDSFMRGSRPRIVRQLYLWSNAIAIQPKDARGAAVQDQVNELLSAVGVADLEGLRQVESGKLVEAIGKLKAHTFRSVTDGGFVPESFLQDVRGGRLAAKLRENRVRVMLGEVKQEALLYKLVNPPGDSAGLKVQIGNYYPPNVVDRLLRLKEVYDVPGDDGKKEQYEDVFAEIVSDMQVHASIRGLAKSLLEPEAGQGMRREDVLRYRVCWRAKGLDEWLAPSVGVCHAADGPIWWASGWRADYTADDRKKAERFLEPFGEFLYGNSLGSAVGHGGAETIDRLLTEDGETQVGVKDNLWEKGMKVWTAVGNV